MVELNCLIPLSYETRNLGLPSFSVSEIFLKNPDEGALNKVIYDKINEFNSLFVQVRLPKKSLQITPILQRCGFYFVESTIIPQTNLNKNIALSKFIENKKGFLPTRYQLEELKVYSVSPSDTVARAKIQEIAEESFSDDRFHIDPNCPDSIANKRFSNWVCDLYTDKSVIFYSLDYCGENIAFMCYKNKDLILAGFNKKYRNSGLGEFLWLSVLEIMLLQGISQATTLISVNNSSVLNLYSRLGFKFKHPSVTFHYWNI